jgi:hypothetical protein
MCCAAQVRSKQPLLNQLVTGLTHDSLAVRAASLHQLRETLARNGPKGLLGERLEALGAREAGGWGGGGAVCTLSSCLHRPLHESPFMDVQIAIHASCQIAMVPGCTSTSISVSYPCHGTKLQHHGQSNHAA